MVRIEDAMPSISKDINVSATNISIKVKPTIRWVFCVA
jgi:hypothetical protein